MASCFCQVRHCLFHSRQFQYMYNLERCDVWHTFPWECVILFLFDYHQRGHNCSPEDIQMPETCPCTFNMSWTASWNSCFSQVCTWRLQYNDTYAISTLKVSKPIFNYHVACSHKTLFQIVMDTKVCRCMRHSCIFDIMKTVHYSFSNDISLIKSFLGNRW